MSYLSDNAYLAIKPEATAGTAVIPTIFVPLVSEDLKTVVGHTADRRMKGLSWKGNDLLRGNRNHEGDIVVLCDPDNLGHILNMVMAKGATTGDAANGYTHPFTVGAPKTYTFEIKRGLYAQRYFGVAIDQVKLGFDNGQMQATFSVKAMGQFSVGNLGVALTGAGMTALVFDDEYDITPNNGLVVGDVITVGGVDVTLTSVNANGTTVGFASTAITASIGATVYLKPLTVTNPTLYDPFYFGNLLVGTGVDTAAATTAAARATATPIYDLEIVLNNNLFAKNGSSRLEPIQLKPQTPEAQVTFKTLLENADQKRKWLAREKEAITMIFYGKFIKTDFTTQEKLTLKFYKVKAIDNPNKLEVGALVSNEESYEVLYDDSDAKAMTADLVNRTAGTSY